MRLNWINAVLAFMSTFYTQSLPEEIMDEPGPKSTRWQRDAFVRIQDDGDFKNVVLAEQDRLIHIVFSSGLIVDCYAARRKYEILENLMAEVEAYEESGEFPPDVEFVELETDVGWYGRHARKILRDQLRSIQLDESELSKKQEEELKDRLWISKDISGTNFCSRQPPKKKLTTDNLGERQELDKCCLDLQSCSDPLTPLEYRHSLLNPSLFPLFPCNCLATFLNCLSNLAEEESYKDSREDARRLERVWRTYGGHCYNLESKTRCTEYNTWFTECLEGNTTEVAIRSHVHTASLREDDI